MTMIDLMLASGVLCGINHTNKVLKRQRADSDKTTKPE